MTTITVQQSLNWAQPFIRNAPMAISGSEPALTSANIILQTMLRPPFAWPWNRATAQANLAAGNQDLVIDLADFGHLEKCSVTDPNGNTREIEIRNVIGAGSEQARPKAVATQANDGAGNITFRFLPAPDAGYQATLTYQKRQALLTALGSSWAPVPDELSHIYNQGLLGFALLLEDDVRAQYFLQRFALSLVSESEGLDETQKNLFLGHWLQLAREQQATQLRTQAGAAGRNT